MPADAPSPMLANQPGGTVRVLHEDSALLVVDKPAGIVVHPAYRNPSGTLADAVFARQTARGEGRPWLLHRLDRETSGVVLFAKTAAARRALVRQFERRTVGKYYVTLVTGVPPEAGGTIDAPLQRDPADRRRVIVAVDGQPARTYYEVRGAGRGVALLLVRPVTGRTHQIRAHLAAIGHPLIGDVTYLPESAAERAQTPRAMLHAWQISVRYPGTGEWVAFRAPWPSDLVAAVAGHGLASALDDLAVRQSLNLADHDQFQPQEALCS